ncbi:IF-2B-domain-containing protein [Rickenella mellea]|uniref:Translation initiation factor eIF2B subunit delta n=1 Tax=Rickenella mellea TaxID=50990 RepID=A0A4R5XDT4_9AGAM|nr:IF-2B-domain-containing protein [Rickenella mellea]
MASVTSPAVRPESSRNAIGTDKHTPKADQSDPPRKQQKDLTKAERRALQEKQRAEKEAAKAAGPAKGAKGGKPAASTSSAPQKKQAGGIESSKAQSTPLKMPRDAGQPTGHDQLSQSRGLRIFSHFGLQKPTSHVKGDIHPVIVRLGLQFSSFKIVGANARCIATLTAFKSIIQDYSTPPNTTLSRHLMTHLSPQINHLVTARPMAVTMGNAIRQLKLDISNSDIDMPEQDAKDLLCKRIDDYIRDRIIMADHVIQDIACKKIKDGDVILTYARSSVVENVLLHAHAEGKKISVIVVDSRPMLEGKNMLTVLSSRGIPCKYLLLPALGSTIMEASTVILGAHSLHSDGAVFSRAGTALVAMMAKHHSIPVMVCCETYKFSEGVQLDSFTKNELAPQGDPLSTYPLVCPKDDLTLQPLPNLEILNPLYDLTPPTCITAVVTEVGIIPPNSISSIPLTLGR